MLLVHYILFCRHYAFEIDKYKQSMSGNGPPYTAGNFPAPVQGAMQPPFSNVYPAPGAQSNYPAY